MNFITFLGALLVTSIPAVAGVLTFTSSSAFHSASSITNLAATACLAMVQTPIAVLKQFVCLLLVHASYTNFSPVSFSTIRANFSISTLIFFPFFSE